MAIPFRSAAKPTPEQPQPHRRGDDVIPTGGLARRADCCPAPALYRVVLSWATRPPCELLLCGHHYRASTATLLLYRATVFGVDNQLLASAN